MINFVGMPALFDSDKQLPFQIRNNLLKVPDQDPKKSKALKAFQSYGVDESLDFEQAKSAFLANELSNQSWINQYPTLAARLASEDFTAVARDELGNLIETEGWWNQLYNGWNIARDTVAIGNMGTRAMMEGRELYPYERRKIERSRELQRAHTQSMPDWTAAASELAGTMLETLGYSATAGKVTGAVFPPAVPFVMAGTAFATSFNLEAGNLYAELIMDGYTASEAVGIASGFGALIAAVDTVGLKYAAAGAKGFGKELMPAIFNKLRSEALKKRTVTEATKAVSLDLLGAVTVEPLTEGVQEVLNERAKVEASRLYRPEDLYEPEYAEVFGHALWHTFKGMVFLGGIPAGARYIHNVARSAEAQVADTQIQEGLEQQRRSNAPEVREEVNEAAGETTLHSTYYVDAEGFQLTVKEIAAKDPKFVEVLETEAPGFLDSVNEAAKRGGRVSISKAKFEKIFALTDAQQVASQHVAVEEDGMTKRESDYFEKNKERLSKEVQEEIDGELLTQEKFQEEIKEVREALQAKIRESIGVQAESGMTANANADVLIAIVRRNSLVMGISPKAYAEKHLPQIAQQRLNNQAAQQQQATPSVAPTPDTAQTSPQTTQQQAPVQQESEQTDSSTQSTSTTTQPASQTQSEQQQVAPQEAEMSPVDQLLQPDSVALESPSSQKALFKETDFRPGVVQWAKNQFGNRIAPNGNPVWQNFVEWFGDSQVVDEKGNPKVMFHGSPQSGYSIFNYKFLSHGLFGIGIYTTDNTKVASGYQSKRAKPKSPDERKGPGVYPLYLKVDNAIDMDAEADLSQWTTAFPDVEFPMPTGLFTNEDAYRIVEEHFKLSQWKPSNEQSGRKAKYVPVNKDLRQSSESRLSPSERKGEDKADLDAAERVQEVLISMGYDGISHLGGDRKSKGSVRHRVFIAFDQDQVQSVHNEGDFSQSPHILKSKDSDTNTLGEATVVADSITKILLDPDANPTTLMHELMHWNLEEMARMGLNIESKMSQEGYEATLEEQRMLSDIKALLEWSGFKGTLTQWESMTVDQRRQYHEAISVSFEKYLYEGVAPSPELKGIFSRLASYVRAMYESVIDKINADYRREFKRDLPSLDKGDIRAVFGRMMSADHEVEGYRQVYEAEAMTMEEWVVSRGGKDLDDEEKAAAEAEWREYNQEFLDSINEAKGTLTQKRMEEVGFQQRARQRINAEISKERKAAQKRLKEEVQKELQVQPVFQLQGHIHNGEYHTEDDLVKSLKTGTTRKLNKAEAKRLITDPVKLEAIKHLLAKDGVPFESYVDFFIGFESIEDLAQKLADSGKLKRAVEVEVDRRMIEEYSDLTDPILIEERVRAAVHNKTRRRVIALELRALLKNGVKEAEQVRLMRALAQEIIGKEENGKINLSEYSRAAAQARKKSLRALKEGNMEAAAFAKRQELLNESLVIEGLKVREEARKLVRLNKTIFRQKSDQKLGKTREIEIVKALRALLSMFGVGKATQDIGKALSDFAARNPEYYREVQERIDYFRNLLINLKRPETGDRLTKLERLTVQDIRSLYSLAREMWKYSSYVRKVEIDGQKVTVEEAKAEAMAPLARIKEQKDGGFWSFLQNTGSSLRRVEHLFRRIDMGKLLGPWTKMFRTIKDAANNYRSELLLFMSKDKRTGEGFDYEGRLKALDLKMPNGMKTVSAKFGGEAVVFGSQSLSAKSEIIHLAMHFYGNPSNREKIVSGYADAEGKNIAEVEASIEKFLKDMTDSGALTKTDFAFMQSVFDQLNSNNMLGRAQAVMRRMRGSSFEAIKSSSFIVTFPDGTSQEYDGGYIPVHFEKQELAGDTVTDYASQSVDMMTATMAGYLPVTTPAKFTTERTKTTYKVQLGLGQVSRHAAEVYRYINMAEASSNVSKVIESKEIKQALDSRFGKNTSKYLKAWLNRSTLQRAQEPTTNEFYKFIQFISRSANMGIMFMNVGNSIQNYAGLVMPMRQIGTRGVVSALIKYAANSTSGRNSIIKDIVSKSKEMKGRLEKQIFDIYTEQSNMLADTTSKTAKGLNYARSKAYFLQQITQNHVDIAVWQAAYNKETSKALSENMSEADAEKQAVAYADSIVRRTQMAGNPEDISMFEAGGSLAKAMFPFKSWFINWLNNAATQGRLDLDHNGRAKAAELFSSYIYLLMIPAVLAQAATELARGELLDDDDDDDGISDDLLEMAVVSQISQAIGGVPVLSEVTQGFMSMLDDKYWNNRYPTLPYKRALENLYKAPFKLFKDPSSGAAFDFAGAVATVGGIPLEAITDRASIIVDQITGELRSESTYDAIRAQISGKRSASQRL